MEKINMKISPNLLAELLLIKLRLSKDSNGERYILDEITAKKISIEIIELFKEHSDSEFLNDMHKALTNFTLKNLK